MGWAHWVEGPAGAVTVRAGSAVGLAAVLVAVTNGTHPYNGHTMGWTNPAVFGVLAGGLVLSAAFVITDHLARFGTAVTLRHHFQRILGTSPTAYREQFRQAA